MAKLGKSSEMITFLSHLKRVIFLGASWVINKSRLEPKTSLSKSVMHPGNKRPQSYERNLVFNKSEEPSRNLRQNLFYQIDFWSLC